MTITMKPSPRISGSFKEWLKDYLQNSSVAGCAYYVMPGRPSKEKIFWLIVHISSVILIVFMTMKATISYTSNKTVTTIETDKFPVQDIDFPGIAICSLNKISRKAAWELANDTLIGLKHFSNTNFTLEEIMDLLKYLGHIYPFEFHESEWERIKLLHKLLNQRFSAYSFTHLFEKLRPNCGSMLSHCFWNGNIYYCDDLFVRRKTGDGICCTFNYARRHDQFGTNRVYEQNEDVDEVQKANSIGSRFGVSVVLENNLHDEFYKALPIMGYKVLVFSPLDYPDAASGSLHEIIIPHGMESFLTLHATTLFSHPDVSILREDERDCRFANELPGIFEGYYSHSDCLMHCRLLDIIARCNCFPFFYPYPSEIDKLRFCDLMDLPCLNKYRSRWWSVKPRFEKNTKLYDEDHSEGSNGVLNCTDCLPACTDVVYEVSVSFAPLSPREVPFQNFLLNTEDKTIVHIFFKRAGIIKLRQDVLYYWYELMSNYGGIGGFFLGISIISVVEFLYFFTLRLFKKKEKSEDQRNSQFTFVKAARPSHRPLYWKEMVQPNLKY